MAIDAARAKSLFLNASDLIDPVERAAYLERECGGDCELRDRVEALLRVNDAAPLPRSGAGDAAPARVSDGLPPTEINSDPTARVGATLAGKYKLIEEIGAGGMGSVYMAQQTEPVKRAVAVKVVKAGMDSRAVLVRFEAERQALAIMDHPNIAKVLDAGATEGGRPFFVMELVKGTPITHFCDERKLTPRQRLELFVPVCQAIEHAHQKGIIHRDIKPSNVLVAMYDDRPVPKVIDFGVAKAAGQTLTDKTLMTGFGAVVGTPEYMSPEQANLNNMDIDTRSDVYSLGVLLYELLTGSTPVDRKSLGQAALLEILRIVREVEAPRPSAKLSTIDTLPSVAACRGTEPAKLPKLMQGELDWVLLKALEKDRTRRYDSANGLARDIQRYLADEVVEARPPSTGYRLKKFVRRHKGEVIAASLVVLALVAGMAGTTVGMVRAVAAEEDAKRDADRARRAEDLANDRLSQVNQQREQIATAEKKARDAADKARNEADSTMGGLVFIDKVLRTRDDGSTGGKIDLKKMLDEMSKVIEHAPRGQSLAGAAIREFIATGYDRLQDWRSAQPHLEKSYEIRQKELGDDHRDTLRILQHLGIAYHENGNDAKSATCFRQILDSVRRGGEAPPAFTITLRNVAEGYRKQKKYADAEPLMAECVKRLSEELPGSANLMDGERELAEIRDALGKFAEAEPLRVKLVEFWRPAQDSVEFAAALLNLGLNQFRQQKHAEAQEPLRECVRICEQKNPNRWSIQFDATSLLGAVLAGQKKFADAEPLLIAGYEGLQNHKADLPWRPPVTDALERLVQLYDAWDKKSKADEWRQKLKEAQAAPKPPAQP